jgi:hypothetical protein
LQLRLGARSTSSHRGQRGVDRCHVVQRVDGAGTSALGAVVGLGHTSSAPRAASISGLAVARRWCSALSSSHSSARGQLVQLADLPGRRSRSRSSVGLLAAGLVQRVRRRARPPQAACGAGVSTPACASSRARTAAGRVRLCQACWPWMSTRCSASLAQLRGTWRAAVDPGAALALRVDHAAQQQRGAAPGVEAGFVQPGRQQEAARVELGGDVGARRALAHHPGVAAAAQRQLQRVDQDGLARAGLAGQHGEAGAQVHFQLVTMTKSRR